MKTILKNVPGWGSLLTLVAGLTSAAIAGPSAQFWQQQEKLRAENAAKAQAAAVTAKVQPAAMACPSCKTSLVTEFSSTNVSGKWAPSFKPVGLQHECAACGSAIAKVRGNVTDHMQANCPICAKAKSCCSL